MIQGTADVSNKLSQEELDKTLEFCSNAFSPVNQEDRNAVLEKIAKDVGNNSFQVDLLPEEVKVVNHIRARQMMRTEDTINMDSYGKDSINGLFPNLRRGNLGLVTHAA